MYKTRAERSAMSYAILAAITGLVSRCPVYKSNRCKSVEDRAPADFIYGCMISKLVQRLHFLTGHKDSSSSNGGRATYPIYFECFE